MLGNGPSWNLCNSHTPNGDFEPISWPILVVGSAQTGAERPRPGGTERTSRPCNRLLWNWCTLPQMAGTYNRLYIFHLQWPMMRHPIWSRIPTLASVERWHHSSSGTSLWAHHPQGIWKIWVKLKMKPYNTSNITLLYYIYFFYTNWHYVRN